MVAKTNTGIDWLHTPPLNEEEVSKLVSLSYDELPGMYQNGIDAYIYTTAREALKKYDQYKKDKKSIFKEWFDGSKVVDKRGRPLIVYRGQHGPDSDKIQNRLPVISFGTKGAADTYAYAPNNRTLDKLAINPHIIAAYLSIKNPVINTPDDPFIEFEAIINAVGLENAKKIALGVADYITPTNNWDEEYSADFESVQELVEKAPERIKGLYVDAYAVFDEPEFVEMFKQAGFDGLIQGGNGETAMEPEYKVFDKSQIWIIEPGAKKMGLGGELSKRPTVEKYAYKKGDKVVCLMPGQSVTKAVIDVPAPIEYDEVQVWVTNKGYVSEDHMLPEITSAKRESSGGGYKMFKGLGGGKNYKIQFADGDSYTSYKETREDAIEDAVWYRLHRAKDYPKTTFKKEVGDLTTLNYALRHPNDAIVFVDADMLLKRHLHDEPEYAVLVESNQIGRRVENAKEFLILNVDRKGVYFEPSVAGIYNGKLSFEDGRHRVLAAKELGYHTVAVEVPKDQVALFEKEFSPRIGALQRQYAGVGPGEENEMLSEIESNRILATDFSKMDVYVDPSMIIPDKALPPATDDFDWNAIYAEAAKDTSKSDPQAGIDQNREEAYQHSRFDKNWAPTYKDAVKKLTEKYTAALATKKEWESKQYKQNKTVVEVGAKDSDFGPALSIGGINEGKKRKKIASAEMDMKEALEDLNLLGLIKEEIHKLTEDAEISLVPESSSAPLKVVPNKVGRHQIKKYGIDIIDAKKHEPSNILLEEKYKVAEDSELPADHTFELFFILKSKIDQQKPFAVGYFGDSRANRYEYASASNDLQELIRTMKDYDQEEAIVETYDPATKEVSASVIYPEANTYTYESLGLVAKEPAPANVNASILKTRLKIVSAKVLEEPNNSTWKTRKKIIEAMIENAGLADFNKSESIVAEIDKRLSLAKESVGGRIVRSGIPNRSSIDASLGDKYKILTGIREVPFTEFPDMGDLRYYDAHEKQKTQKLAEEIKESGEINPLIVVYDKRGAYVLEGGHRFDALRELNAKSFPALVVIDTEDLSGPDDYAKGGPLDNLGNSEKQSNFTKDEIQNILSGKSQVRQGNAIQAAASYLRTNGSFGKEVARTSKAKEGQSLEFERKSLERYISENNLWFEDGNLGIFLKSGSEQSVFQLGKSDFVVKLNRLNTIYYNSWLQYFYSLLLHNYFFDDTAYELIGFTKYNGQLNAVVKQPYIDWTDVTKIEDIIDFMSENEFYNSDTNVNYTNTELGVRINDLHIYNVLTRKDDKGDTLYFVDTNCYFDGVVPEFYDGGSVKNDHQVIVLNNSNSVYDRSAQRLILDYLNSLKDGEYKKLIEFIKESGQKPDDYETIFYLNPAYHHAFGDKWFANKLSYQRTADEAWGQALANDDERPNFIRVQRKGKVTTYAAAPEFGLFGDYSGDLYEEDGHLKQSVKDNAIQELKEALFMVS
jgi:hypothetical protein